MKLSARIVAAITMVAVLHLPAISVQAQEWTVPVYGCLQGTKANAVLRNKDILVNTGKPFFDALMIEEITVLNDVFDVNVPVYIPNDKMDDAFFTPYRFPKLIERDGGDPDDRTVTGSVFISEGFFNKEFNENPGGLNSIPAILAHEFAHARQYKKDFPYKATLWRELHADFLAGWFLALRFDYLGDDPCPAFYSFYNKGSNRGFFNPNHHGTKDQRVAAMEAGYDSYFEGVESGVDAYNVGIEYVKYLGAR